MWTLALGIATAAHGLELPSSQRFDEQGQLIAIVCGAETLDERHTAWCSGAEPVTLHFPGDGRKATFGMKQGQLHGEHTSYRSDGSVQTVAHYVAGVKQGRFEDYRPDGTLERVRTLDAGRMRGEQLTYHPDGTTVAQRDTHDPDVVPPTIAHEKFTEAGLPTRSIRRTDDRYHVVTFHPDGQKAAEGDFTVAPRCRPNPVCLGKPVGEHTTYAPDGTVAETKDYGS